MYALGYHSTEFMSSYGPVSDAWPAKVAIEMQLEARQDYRLYKMIAWLISKYDQYSILVYFTYFNHDPWTSIKFYRGTLFTSAFKIHDLLRNDLLSE